MCGGHIAYCNQFLNDLKYHKAFKIKELLIVQTLKWKFTKTTN